MSVTAEDLIKAGKHEVRTHAELMSAYIRLFQERFGREPDCAGCTFDYDWKRLTGTLTPIHTENMSSDITFKLRDNSIIYSFYREDKETGIIRKTRCYGNIMTEEFAEEYLTSGSPEEIESRKKEFKVLPGKFQEKPWADKETSSLQRLSELKAKASEKGYPKEEFNDISEESEMIVYLDGKALESEETKNLQEAVEQTMTDHQEGKSDRQEIVLGAPREPKASVTPELTSDETARVPAVSSEKATDSAAGKAKNEAVVKPIEQIQADLVIKESSDDPDDLPKEKAKNETLAKPREGKK